MKRHLQRILSSNVWFSDNITLAEDRLAGLFYSAAVTVKKKKVTNRIQEEVLKYPKEGTSRQGKKVQSVRQVVPLPR